MILVWLLVAVVVGAAIGRLAGFMAGEFVVTPLLLLARLVAYLSGPSRVGRSGCPDRARVSFGVAAYGSG